MLILLYIIVVCLWFSVGKNISLVLSSLDSHQQSLACYSLQLGHIKLKKERKKEKKKEEEEEEEVEEEE